MKTRLYAAGIMAGLAILAVTMFAIFEFGRKHPSPPSLEDHPNPAIAGQLLFVDRDSCFIQADASGASRVKRACFPGSLNSPQMFWPSNDEAAVVRHDSRGGVLFTIDLNNGTQQDTGRAVSVDIWKPGPGGYGGGNFAPDGTYGFAEPGGDLFVIVQGVRTKVASFDVPKYEQPQVLIWSPDSQWMVLSYYPHRSDGPELWIVGRDGKTKGTLARDLAPASGVAWRMDGLPTQPPMP